MRLIRNKKGLNMKRILLIFLASLCLGLSGCNLGVATSNKPVVYTSFYAMYDITRSIAKDKVELLLLIPSGIEPHDWEPSTTDMVKLESADMLIYNGAGMEHFIDSFKSSVNNKKLKYVEASKDVPVIDEYNDPHVWLNPQYAKSEAKTITDALCELDPQNSDYYTDNFNEFSTNIDVLDGEYKETLFDIKSRNIVVAHAAYAYLCKAYNLNQVAIEGFAAEDEPSPARMKEIVDYINANDVKVIFTEELISTKVAESISRETGASVDVLSPFESGTADYFSVMRENLKSLKAALK